MGPAQDIEESHTRRSARVGLQTAVIDNSAAFGFSITITSSFGVLNQLAGTPSLVDIFGFAMGAAAAFTLLQAAATRGFRRQPGAAPLEVILLGTALDMLSVALGFGAAVVIGTTLPVGAAWPVGSFLAALAFAFGQALVLMLAALLKRLSGDSGADDEER
ncbi:hypothetical protein [Streptomyces sp. TP-A0874]|uniref:hypothetical protein n=1 Tax=Streptomyces sp. TP-A0874 TaxID=549819 RepID=UPI000853317A|nr:hypothetical protein [Streptomyces sp. TP-A0874]